MQRLVLGLVVVSLAACGPLTPPRDAGAGGGGGLLGGGGTTGGGSGGGATGGGAGGGAGGGVTGGGAGGGVTGGGTGGGGGGSTDAGVDAGVPPLTWSVMGLSGGSGSGPIVGLSGPVGNVWAVQDNGVVYRSTGGAFSARLTFSGGARDIAVSGSNVVVVRYRAVQLCTNGACGLLGDFTTFDLVARGLDSHAACVGPSGQLAFLASDTNYNGHLFELDGGTWEETNANLGLRYPRDCWFGADGSLFATGESKVIRIETGAATPETVAGTPVTFFSGAQVDGTNWVSGASANVARFVDGGWSTLPVTSTNTLFTVGGLRGDEVFAFGLWQSSVGNGYRWNGSTLSGVGDLLPSTGAQSSMQSLHVAGPNELYVGGNTTSGPVIIRGRR